MKSLYKLIFDTGKVFYISAKTRAKAIEQYCEETGVCKDWITKHCRIVNMGKGEA